ncbi:hypothetical protein K474DRAFT_225143 [Panus rudis PR-1116 ss-1]|nr:hypothetical protein K474DRAFT_225143 [Panus rudis PR-1116 ss-1]
MLVPPAVAEVECTAKPASLHPSSPRLAPYRGHDQDRKRVYLDLSSRSGHVCGGSESVEGSEPSSLSGFSILSLRSGVVACFIEVSGIPIGVLVVGRNMGRSETSVWERERVGGAECDNDGGLCEAVQGVFPRWSACSGNDEVEPLLASITSNAGDRMEG